MKNKFALTALAVVASVGTASAVSTVQSGLTSVALDTATLTSAAGLTISGTSSDVVSSGNIANSVGFNINSPSAATSPTSFTYTVPGLTPFSGVINHTGSVFFNTNSVEVGNFLIGFDNVRAVGTNSGFFVESTTGVAAILFDIANISPDTVADESLVVSGDLAVSPEFAQFLQDQGLAASDLTGADVGDAQISGDSAVVPEPSTTVALLLGGLGLMARRRR